MELKLALTTDAIERLLGSPLLREHARSAMVSRRLSNTYYDTPDHRLSDKGIAFRVRHIGRKYIQTLKTAGSGSGPANDRGEWEIEIPDGKPQLAAFGDPQVLELTGLVLPDELQAVFETKFRRRSLLVEWADGSGLPARIEVAVDEGAVQAGGRKMPICELELELKEGDPRALFELVAEMRAIVPLRFYPLDKAARGYMLAGNAPPRWRKAPPLLLAPDMTVEDALSTILGSATRHWIDNEAAAVDGRESEGLHQLRVALRRIRSALSLFRPALPEASRKQWDAELKWLLSHLGAARDLDVFAGETLPPVREARREDRGIVAVGEAADRRRKEAHEDLRATIGSHRYADLLFGFSIWTARRGWRQGAEFETLLIQRQPIEQLARKILRKRHRAVLKAGSGFEDLGPEARHKVRIAFKKLRYGLEFFESLFPEKEVRRFRRHAADMQDLLGHMNDAVVADRIVHDLVAHKPGKLDPVQIAMGGGEVIGWYARKLEDEEPAAIEAWQTFVAQEPFWKDK